MSHPETLVIHRGYAGHLVEDSVGGFLADRTPTGTFFENFNSECKGKAIHLHPIGPFGERLNNEFLVLRPPSPHDLF
jgi:hypothetical protein